MENKYQWTGNVTFWDLHSESKESLRQTGVYEISHTSKSGYYYIGSAAKSSRTGYRDTGFLQRWKEHFYHLRKGIHHNNHLQAIVKKYGIAGLRFKVIEGCAPQSCTERETYYIRKYFAEHKIFNHNKSGSNCLGVKHSKDSVEKRRYKKAKKVYQYDLAGNFIKEWRSYSDAKRFIGSGANLSRCLAGKGGSSGGFQWSYNKEEKSFYEQYYHKVEEPVYKFDYNGNLLNKYINPTDAADKTGIDIKYIFRSANKTYIRGGNFIWSWQPEENRRWPFRKTRKAVLQFDKNMNLIKEFPSLTLAAEAIGSDKTAIANCCKEKPHCKSVKGFIFKYKPQVA